jgi:hypothetical protein
MRKNHRSSFSPIYLWFWNPFFAQAVAVLMGSSMVFLEQANNVANVEAVVLMTGLRS